MDEQIFLSKYLLSALEILDMYLSWSKSKRIISSKLKRKKLMYVKNGKYNVFDNPAQKQMKIYPFPRNLLFCVHLLHDGASIILKGFL